MITRLLAPRVDMILFQHSLEVVTSDVGVENYTSKVSLSLATVIFTLCVSFLWDRVSNRICLDVTLVPWGT